ncbi:tRNA pseudouridine(38-40) synthase TruA [Thiohalorhabdus methylotrophus]|uniref:tRNA pseudouridine synthase A n=1 Tax=Thiohalorhabdus methylotrophus TaxID=3242694 RepID=A0ABV4TU02_9GAMM
MAGRMALLLEFDGSRFHGWQRQTNAMSVQEALETALSRVADAPVRAVAAGRTDAGVHGLGMVVHFDPPVERPAEAWIRGVNAHLPQGAAVVEAVPVAAGFDARRKARARTYLYRLLARPGRPGLEQGRVTWVRGPLDAEAMAEGGRWLQGRRDFSAFRAAGCQAAHPVREVQRLAVRALGEEIQVAVRADAFLYNMVRIMVGSLVEVGLGRQNPAWIGEVLTSGDRERAGPTARPEGLYFAAVHYPPEWGAPAPPTRGPGGFDPAGF